MLSKLTMKSAYRAFPVDEKESGFIMVAMVIILLPLTLVVAAFMSSMTGRSLRLREEVVQEKALLAAESGLDHAIYVSRTGGLTDGDMLVRAFGRGMAFSVEPTYMGGDGLDNDSDGDTDEADEDIFRVIIRGTYRGATRRLAAYLGATSTLPTVEAAVTGQSPSVGVQLPGTPMISGKNTNIDGSRGNPAEDVTGMLIATPGTVAHLLTEITADELDNVDGLGGTPSLGVTSPIDLPAIVTDAKNAASIVLTNNEYSSFNFGDASVGNAYITYREGDVKFTGDTRGAGLLVVTGKLEMVGNFRFDGVIIVMGDIDNSAGIAQVYGGILSGPASGQFTFKGTSGVYFSSQAIDIANTLTSRYVVFNGWQELSRK